MEGIAYSRKELATICKELGLWGTVVTSRMGLEDIHTTAVDYIRQNAVPQDGISELAAGFLEGIQGAAPPPEPEPPAEEEEHDSGMVPPEEPEEESAAPPPTSVTTITPEAAAPPPPTSIVGAAPAGFKPPEAGKFSALNVDLSGLGLVDLGCVGMFAEQNATCFVCPEMRGCIEARNRGQVYLPDKLRTREDLEVNLRKPSVSAEVKVDPPKAEEESPRQEPSSAPESQGAGTVDLSAAAAPKKRARKRATKKATKQQEPAAPPPPAEEPPEQEPPAAEEEEEGPVSNPFLESQRARRAAAKAAREAEEQRPKSGTAKKAAKKATRKRANKKAKEQAAATPPPEPADPPSEAQPEEGEDGVTKGMNAVARMFTRALQGAGLTVQRDSKAVWFARSDLPSAAFVLHGFSGSSVTKFTLLECEDMPELDDEEWKVTSFGATITLKTMPDADLMGRLTTAINRHLKESAPIKRAPTRRS